MSNSLIEPIDRILSGATTPDQSGPGINGNEGVLCIPQSSSITGTLMIGLFSDIFKTLVGGEGGLTSSAEMQSVYSTAPANWAKKRAAEEM